MTSLRKTTLYEEKPVTTHVQNFPFYAQASKVARFLWHFLEMLLAMGVGMAVFHLLVKQIPASSGLVAVADKDTVLHKVVMDFFMTVPMLAWMILRGHGWRHSLEMGVAMLAPIALINLLCSLGLVEYVPWLTEASGPAMFLGMLAAMLYRRDHYTVKTGHSVHAAHQHVEKAQP